jgi:uncharacterized protein YqgQ
MNEQGSEKNLQELLNSALVASIGYIIEASKIEIYRLRKLGMLSKDDEAGVNAIVNRERSKFIENLTIVSEERILASTIKRELAEKNGDRK